VEENTSRFVAVRSGVVAGVVTGALFVLLAFILLELVDKCIVEPNTHEWLHHIGACLSNVPNIQLPMMVIVPFWTIPFVQLTVNFPYMVANAISLGMWVPFFMLGVLLWKKDHPIGAVILITVALDLLLIGVICSMLYINPALQGEWLTDAIMFGRL